MPFASYSASRLPIPDSNKLNPASSSQSHDQADQEKNHEKNKQNSGHSGKGQVDATKAKKRGNQRYQKKYQCVIKHNASPPFWIFTEGLPSPAPSLDAELNYRAAFLLERQAAGPEVINDGIGPLRPRLGVGGLHGAYRIFSS